MEIIKVILTSILSAAVLFLLAKIMGHNPMATYLRKFAP